MSEMRTSVRIAAVADLHRDARGTTGFRDLFAHAQEVGDVLLLCGDLTDYGLAEEARLLAVELVHARIPILAVLGNHDCEAGQQAEITRILGDVGVRVLDGQACEIDGVGFAGTKGFAGGFNTHTLEPWGERAIKQFVQEAIDETLKLEMALARLRTPCRVAMLHYAPVRDTVEGEPLEIYPFLGSSRLEEPLNRYRVSAVFHGHAHRGKQQGRTREDIPVYNVSLPLLRHQFPNQPPVHVVTLPLTGDSQAPGPEELAGSGTV